MRLIVNGGKPKQLCDRNDKGLKILTLICFLLLGYLVSGQQPVQDAFREVLGDLWLVPEGDSRLILTGITSSGSVPTAVINGRILAEGDSATVPSKPFPLAIKLLKIERDSVRIAIAGEDQAVLLRPQ